MASFWQSCIEIFEVLLQFQKSIKSGNWELHFDSREKLLLWFHAYDHQTMLVTSRTVGRHNRCYQSHTQRCMKDLLTEISQSTELLEPLTTYYQIKQQSRQSIKTKRAQENKAILYFNSFNKEKHISFFIQFRNNKLQYTIIRTVKNPSAS